MTRRVWRALPVGEKPIEVALLMQAAKPSGLQGPAAAAATSVRIDGPQAFAWTVGQNLFDKLLVSGGTGVYLYAGVGDGSLPSGCGVTLVGNEIRFVGSAAAMADGTATIIVVDSGYHAAAKLVSYVVSEQAIGYLDMPESAVTAGAGMSYDGETYQSAGAYATELLDPKTEPAGEFFRVVMPAGTYTGNVRLTVLTSTLDSPYFHHLFLESTSGAAVPVATYDYDIGALNAGDEIFVPAGVEDAGGAISGEVTFRLQFEGVFGGGGS